MPQIYQTPGPQSLKENGSIFPVIITGPTSQVRTYAMVDDGSSRSSIDSSLLYQVGAYMGGTEPVDTVTANPVMLQLAYGVTLHAP